MENRFLKQEYLLLKLIVNFRKLMIFAGNLYKDQK